MEVLSDRRSRGELWSCAFLRFPVPVRFIDSTHESGPTPHCVCFVFLWHQDCQKLVHFARAISLNRTCARYAVRWRAWRRKTRLWCPTRPLQRERSSHKVRINRAHAPLSHSPFSPVPHHVPSIRHIMAMSRSGHCAHLVAMNDEYCRQFAGPSSSSTLTACSTSWAAWLRASTRTWSRSWPTYSRGPNAAMISPTSTCQRRHGRYIRACVHVCACVHVIMR